MAILQLPVRNDLPSYDFQIVLDGVFVTLGFTFNSRANYWLMDIYDANDNAIVVGIKLVSSWLLTNRFKMDGLPQGDFFIIDTTGNNEDPTQEDFGTTKLLMYADVAEGLNV